MTKKRLLGCLRVPPVEYHWSGAVVFNLFVRVPPDIISLQLGTPKVVGT
jgi:hypothetical protein